MPSTGSLSCLHGSTGLLEAGTQWPTILKTVLTGSPGDGAGDAPLSHPSEAPL